MRIAANTLYSLGQLGLARLASVVTMVALAWTQGPGLVGVFSLALTFYLLLTGWWVGLDDKVVREIARTRSASTDSQLHRWFTWHTIAHYLRLRLAISIALLVAVIGALYWGHWYGPVESWFITLMLVSTVTDNVTAAAVAGYAGNERFPVALAVIVLQTGLRLAFTAVALWGAAGLAGVAVAWLAASILTMLFALLLFVVHFRGAAAYQAFPRSRWFPFAQSKADWSFWVIGIVAILEYQLDIILLSLFWSAVEVGYYSVATTLFSLATLPLQAFRIAVHPAMSRLAAGRARDEAGPDTGALQGLYTWSVLMVLTIALPCALLGFFFADPVITLVFGPALAPAVLPTRILMATVVVFGLNVPQSRFLLATNQQEQAARFIITSAVTNLLANVWLGQAFGAPGTALARGISTTLFLLLAGLAVGRFMRWPGWRLSMTPIAATLLTAGFLALAASWPWWFAALIALLIYGAAWWALSSLTGARTLRAIA